ncbi:hypothetical protein EST38_g13297, partial [Candolleomyces aberdarensis]
MSEFTHSGGGENRGPPDNSEGNTPIQARAATPDIDGSRPPGKASRFRAWVGEKYDKGKDKMERGVQKTERGVKSLLGRGGPKNGGEGETRPQDAGGSGSSDNANVLAMGGLFRDGEAATAGEVGAVDTLASGTAIAPNRSAEVFGLPAEAETGQEATPSIPQLYAASASSPKDEHGHSSDPVIALIISKPGLDEDKAVTVHGIEDVPVDIGAGSGAVRLGNNSLPVVEVTEMGGDTTGAAPQAHVAETVPPSTAASNLQDAVASFQPQATVTPVTSDDNSNSFRKTIIASTVFAPALAEERWCSQHEEDIDEGPPAPAPGIARGVVNEPMSAINSPKVWTIAKGTLKTALGIAVALAPEPFKGPAEALRKVVDIVEKANSNKEEVEILKKNCNLLGSSLVNAVKGKDAKLLSEDLKNSIGRLVEGMWATLEAANKEKSKGIAVYVLAEDDIEVLQNANKKLEKLLQCFWIENHIAGTIVLSDILANVQDQVGWMQGLSAALDKHLENSTLGQLKRIPGAAYDSQEVVAKVVSCFQGTRSALLANVGRWISGSVSDGHNPPVYVLDGIAGVGKSTVAITVAQRAAGINSLGATFFFSQDQDDRKKSVGFVHTIAYQLAHYDASYGSAIAAAMTSNPEALDKVLTQQFNLLVAKPLSPLLKQRATPLVLVFDALDECVEPDASAILDLILSLVPQLPNIKVFLTS